MNRSSKIGIVLAGYVGAAVATWGLFEIYTLTQKGNSAASGGMQAFGDLLLFLGMLAVLSLIPTALALYYLRPVEKFWSALSIVALALAATGPVAAVLVGRLHQSQSVAVAFGFFGLMRILGAPLLGIAFVICAAIAPTRRPRRRLVTATVIEFAVGAYAFFCLLVVGHWLL